MKTTFISFGPTDMQRDSHAHGVATEIPRVARRETETLKLEGCTDARVGIFDRQAGIWVITFTREGHRKAILMWTVEVDA